MYFDRNATMSGAKRSGEQPVVEPTGAPRPARRPVDKAREGGAPTGRTGPGVFRPKRNDERREATRFSRDGSPAEPPPGELGRVGFITGCLAGMDRRPSPHRENWAAWVSSPAVWPGWIAGRAPTGRTGPRGFHYRLFGRDGSPVEPPPGELGRVGFTTGCSGMWGVSTRENAAKRPAKGDGNRAGAAPRSRKWRVLHVIVRAPPALARRERRFFRK